MTEIITLIGDPGGGKSTLGTWFSMACKYARPDMPRFSNVEIGHDTVRVDDLHRFIATKLMHKDRSEMFCLDDEAAQSGLESRGSGSKGAAIESRIITHSRKAGAWLVLISQLKSMLDKRAQWVEAYSILCEAVFLPENVGIVPDYFHYTIYDNELNYVGDFSIDVEDCIKYIWPGMDTYDIPDFEGFVQQFETYWGMPTDMAKGETPEEFKERQKNWREENNEQYRGYMKKAYQYVVAEKVPKW